MSGAAETGRRAGVRPLLALKRMPSISSKSKSLSNPIAVLSGWNAYRLQPDLY